MMRSHIPAQTTPVTLNLFQGPLCLHAPKRAMARLEACGSRGVSAEGTGLAARWTLKQVQGDELGEVRA